MFVCCYKGIHSYVFVGHISKKRPPSRWQCHFFLDHIQSHLKTPTTKQWEIKRSQKKLNIYVYMLQNVYFPNLFTPKCYVFFKKGTCHESERTGGDGNGPMVSLSSCDESTISAQRGLGATAGAAINKGHKGNGVSYDSYESWALCFLGRRVGKVTPLVKASWGSRTKITKNSLIWGKSKLKPKRFMTFWGGQVIFVRVQWSSEAFFEALFEVLYSSKWIKMAKKRRKHVFPNDPTLAKWKRSNFAQWAATLKDPRWHGSSPEAYIEVTYMFGGVYVAKTLHFYVVLGGSWYKKLAFLSLELTLGKKDQTFSTCSCLEELKVVRMGITTNGNVHTSYSSIIFILFLPVHIFYLGKWSPSEKK